MEYLNNIDWADIGEKILAGYAILQVIARATKTKKDDKIVSKIGKFLNIIFSATREK
jgi:hypothetical protein